ncbi:MAG: nshR, partial [Frankiales bacterium]|nr:nshR [Frankiales bacterium]
VLLVEGFHAVKHALRFAPEAVLQIRVASREAAAALADQLAPDVRPALAGAQVGEVAHHTGVQALVRRPAADLGVLQARTAPLVVLDGPRHPGNVGAVIRVAAAASASGVVVTGPLDPWAPGVLRGAAGLHFALPVFTLAGEPVRGPVVLLDADGDDTAPLPADAALVVGSERSGVSPFWRERADLVLALPMRAGVSSLNLATAVAAVLYRGR